jgi:anti-sigma factor RsiW
VNCENSRSLLHGYLDGELDPVRAEEFERHLETCSQCTAELEQQEKLRASLQSGKLYERAPDSVGRKLMRRVASDENEGDWSWLSILQWVGTSAAIVLLAAAAYFAVEGRFKLGSSTAQASLTEVLDAHVRSLQPGHLTDVLSTDQHTVKPWFDGKLDFVPPVPDLADSGFSLIGGRLDVLNGRSVAVLVYGRRKHVINVFVWPESKVQATAPATGSRNGFQWVYVHGHGMEYCAVSDVAATDLNALAELLQE